MKQQFLFHMKTYFIYIGHIHYKNIFQKGIYNSKKLIKHKKCLRLQKRNVLEDSFLIGMKLLKYILHIKEEYTFIP